MAEDQELTPIIDQLALQVLSLEADDVMAMGTMLTQIEAAEKAATGTKWEPIREWFRPLKILLEKLVLMECPNPNEFLALVSEGLRVIQSKIAYGDVNQIVPEEAAYSRRIKAVLGTQAEAAPSEEKAQVPAEGKTEEGPVELSQDLELFNDFVTEAMEHLESIEINLINLEQSPQDKEYLNAIFRPFHTIKGVSGFLNLQDIHKFAHAVESLLDDARNDIIRVNQKVIDLILEAVDFLKNLILERKALVQAGETQASLTDLTSWLERIHQVREGALAAEEKVIEEEPVVPPLGEILTLKGVVKPEAVGEALEDQLGEKHGQKIGEILISDQKAKPKDVIEGLRDQKKLSGSESQATIRVDTKKLDNLVDMVGELVIAQSLVQQNPVLASINDQKLIRDFSQLKRITSDLQKIAMSLRMVPIRHTFQKMIRLVRDLSKKSGKLVELTLFGEETEIDRNMVDTLYDPLVHMIRNAIDHGIELPQVRREKGKPETGEIQLKAYQKGGEHRHRDRGRWTGPQSSQDPGKGQGTENYQRRDRPERSTNLQSDLRTGIFHGRQGDRRLRPGSGHGCGQTGDREDPGQNRDLFHGRAGLPLHHPHPADLGHHGRHFGQDRFRTLHHSHRIHQRDLAAFAGRDFYRRKEGGNDQGPEYAPAFGAAEHPFAHPLGREKALGGLGGGGGKRRGTKRALG